VMTRLRRHGSPTAWVLVTYVPAGGAANSRPKKLLLQLTTSRP
jgi:hypothetical protein